MTIRKTFIKACIYYEDKNNQFHREDGPAIEWVDGTKEWYTNDQLHRQDGPAIEWSDGTNEWYYRGRELKEEDHPFNIFRKEHNLSKNIEEWPIECKLLFKMKYGLN